MTQLVTRVDDDLVAQIDALIATGAVESRSDAVRRGLEGLIDHHRRTRLGEAIVRSYEDRPQVPSDVGWADSSTVQMIGDEPW